MGSHEDLPTRLAALLSRSASAREGAQRALARSGAILGRRPRTEAAPRRSGPGTSPTAATWPDQNVAKSEQAQIDEQIELTRGQDKPGPALS